MMLHFRNIDKYGDRHISITNESVIDILNYKKVLRSDYENDRELFNMQFFVFCGKIINEGIKDKNLINITYDKYQIKCPLAVLEIHAQEQTFEFIETQLAIFEIFSLKSPLNLLLYAFDEIKRKRYYENMDNLNKYKEVAMKIWEHYVI